MTAERFRKAMSESTQLMKEDKYEQALKVLDGAIEEAVGERSSWTRTLCHHAAVICKFRENAQREQQYHFQSLAIDPQDAIALYGLAEIARKRGETEIARQYAAKCYKAIMERDDPITREGLFDLVVKHWPDVVTP